MKVLCIVLFQVLKTTLLNSKSSNHYQIIFSDIFSVQLLICKVLYIDFFFIWKKTIFAGFKNSARHYFCQSRNYKRLIFNMLYKMLICLVVQYFYKNRKLLDKFNSQSDTKTSLQETDSILKRYNLTLVPTSYDRSVRTKILPLWMSKI